MTTTSLAPAAPEAITLNCPDGVALAGHFFARSHANTSNELPVLIAPATGVKQQFYFRFAQWLSQQGHDVLVFDYRGIGLSLHGPLKACRASLVQWGQQDQRTAIDWLLHRTGAAQLVLVGNSAGGQMMGLLPNHDKLARVVGISASSGWFSAMALGFRLKALWGMRVMVPLGIALKGYGTTAALGLGENLPAQVARDWANWCAAGGYATQAVKEHPDQDFHADVRTPICVLYASDDDIANTATVHDLLRTFPAAPSQSLKIQPQDYELKHLGHLNWFRASHHAVWPLMHQAILGQPIAKQR